MGDKHLYAVALLAMTFGQSPTPLAGELPLAAPLPGAASQPASGKGQPASAPTSLPACVAQEVFSLGTTKVRRLSNQEGFFFEAGMAIDADGAPEAYHPQSSLGLDALANAGKPGKWWALVVDEKGEPVVQGESDPAPGFYVSMTSLQDKNLPETDPARYVDASRIPYVVLPRKAMKSAGAKLGDFAVVYFPKKEKLAYAIFADIGPSKKLGEGSIALAEQLGIPSSPRKGGASKGVLYLVFPGSGDQTPKTLEEIQRQAQSRFEAWGGLEQLKACFPSYFRRGDRLL